MNKKWIKSLAQSGTASLFAALLSTAAFGTDNPNGYNKIAEQASCAQVEGQWYICCDSEHCYDATYT